MAGPRRSDNMWAAMEVLGTIGAETAKTVGTMKFTEAKNTMDTDHYDFFKSIELDPDPDSYAGKMEENLHSKYDSILEDTINPFAREDLAQLITEQKLADRKRLDSIYSRNAKVFGGQALVNGLNGVLGLEKLSGDSYQEFIDGGLGEINGLIIKNMVDGVIDQDAAAELQGSYSKDFLFGVSKNMAYTAADMLIANDMTEGDVMDILEKVIRTGEVPEGLEGTPLGEMADAYSKINLMQAEEERLVKDLRGEVDAKLGRKIVQDEEQVKIDIGKFTANIWATDDKEMITNRKRYMENNFSEVRRIFKSDPEEGAKYIEALRKWDIDFSNKQDVKAAEKKMQDLQKGYMNRIGDVDVVAVSEETPEARLDAIDAIIEELEVDLILEGPTQRTLLTQARTARTAEETRIQDAINLEAKKTLALTVNNFRGRIEDRREDLDLTKIDALRTEVVNEVREGFTKKDEFLGELAALRKDAVAKKAADTAKGDMTDEDYERYKGKLDEEIGNLSNDVRINAKGVRDRLLAYKQKLFDEEPLKTQEQDRQERVGDIESLLDDMDANADTAKKRNTAVKVIQAAYLDRNIDDEEVERIILEQEPDLGPTDGKTWFGFMSDRWDILGDTPATKMMSNISRAYDAAVRNSEPDEISRLTVAMNDVHNEYMALLRNPDYVDHPGNRAALLRDFSIRMLLPMEAETAFRSPSSIYSYSNFTNTELPPSSSEFQSIIGEWTVDLKNELRGTSIGNDFYTTEGAFSREMEESAEAGREIIFTHKATGAKFTKHEKRSITDPDAEGFIEKVQSVQMIRKEWFWRVQFPDSDEWIPLDEAKDRL